MDCSRDDDDDDDDDDEKMELKFFSLTSYQSMQSCLSTVCPDIEKESS